MTASLFIWKLMVMLSSCQHLLWSTCFRHLARNPFICDCNLRWLAEYLHRNPIETSGARCDTPKRMQRRRIEAFEDEKFKCKGKQYTLYGQVRPFPWEEGCFCFWKKKSEWTSLDKTKFEKSVHSQS